jgi:methylmalonyl-CoA/ethylmalonyl-CoA epimerase
MTDSLAIHHVSVAVPNLDAAIGWYGRILGFADPQRFQIGELGARGAFLRRGTLRLELWQLDGAAPVPAQRREPNTDLLTCGTKHMALTVQDLGAVLARFVREGVDIAAIQRAPTLPMRQEAEPLRAGATPPFAMFIRDPGGTLIEILDADAVSRVLAD